MTYVPICLGNTTVDVLTPVNTGLMHVNRSSENDLGTSTSDVDICLTTHWPGLKCVRTLAQILKKRS